MSDRRATPLLLGVAAFQVIFGAAVGSVIASQVWMMDAARGIDASMALQAGHFGTDHGYLYSPLTALLIVPATMLPPALMGAAWLAARLAVLVAGVAHETRRLPTADRLLILVAAAMFLPTLHDLMLANITVLLAGAVALIAWSPDRYRTGMPIGLALATAPKPALLPILVWMVIFRRKALVGAVGTAGVVTLVALAVIGTGPYLAWIDVLRTPLYLAGPQGGNLAIGGLLPQPVAIPLEILSIAAGLVALRRGETQGFVASIAIGLLVAPYTLAYAATLLLLTVKPLAGVLPRNVLILGALAAPILVVVFLPALAGAILLIAVAVAPSRWPSLHPENPHPMDPARPPTADHSPHPEPARAIETAL